MKGDPGYADNAICPECRTYTRQEIVSRGVRKCECGEVFNLRDTTRIQHGKVIYPPFKEVTATKGGAE